MVFANPNERVVIALVTDGTPNACGSTPEKVAALAQEAASTDPEVLTYGLRRRLRGGGGRH